MDSIINYDVIVIGLGAMGSSTLYNLSNCIPSLKILGIEQFLPPHLKGSSHGETRITRQIYFEDPCYVPLLKKSYKLWSEIEKKTGTKLFAHTGGIYIGEPEGPAFLGLKKTAKEHNFDIKIMDNKETMKKYPVFDIPENMCGLYDPTAGILFPEKCIEAFLALSSKNGANMQFGEQMISFKEINLGLIEVKTTRNIYHTKKLILTMGAYASKILNLPLKIERKVIFWIEPPKENSSLFNENNLPIYLIHDKDIALYGFPNILGTGVKTASHVNHQYIDIDKIDRTISEKEKNNFLKDISRFMPTLGKKINKIETCLYTMTPDEHFIIDFLPGYKNVIIGSPCSGHGFKFSVVIGEILKDLCLIGRSEFNIEPFKANRFSKNLSKL